MCGRVFVYVYLFVYVRVCLYSCVFVCIRLFRFVGGLGGVYHIYDCLFVTFLAFVCGFVCACLC
jgi:hypothetical protein